MSEPITCIKKPEPAVHTPGPWRAINNDLREGGAVYAGSEMVALVLLNDANLPLIAAAPDLLAFAECMLPQMIAERDCYYEGCSVNSTGKVHDIEDQMTLDHYDHDIDALRALIAAAKGEA